MLREQNILFRQLNALLDTLILMLSFWLAHVIRKNIPHLVALSPFRNYAWLLIVIIPLWNPIFHINRLYPTNRLRSIREAFGIIVKSGFIGTATTVLVLYLLKKPHISRPIVVGFGTLTVLFMMIKEVAIRRYFKRLRKTKRNLRNAIIVGEKDPINKMFHLITENEYLGLNILGYILIGPGKIEEASLKNLGEIGQIRKILHKYPVDMVIAGLPRRRLAEIEDPLAICEEEGVELWITADIFHTVIAKPYMDELEGIPLIVFRTTPVIGWQLFFKRIIDILLSFVLLIALLPVFTVVAVSIKLTSPGPLLFKQKRMGLRGRKFIMLKFRSMVTNAEQRRNELRKFNIMKGPVFKVRDDPRITGIGKFLRKWSLDELPQLWNVFLGQMSLVGPRPPLPAEVAKYKGWQRRRLSMRPGMSCLWQISGRSNIFDFNEWATLDLQYIDNWSFWLDIKILFKTLPAVLKRAGAE